MRYLILLMFKLPWWAYLPLAGGLAYMGEQAYQSGALIELAGALGNNPMIINLFGQGQEALAPEVVADRLRWTIWGGVALIALFALVKRHLKGRRSSAVIVAASATAATEVPVEVEHVQQAIYTPPPHGILADDEYETDDYSAGDEWDDDEAGDCDTDAFDPDYYAPADPEVDEAAEDNQGVAAARRFSLGMRIASAAAVTTVGMLVLAHPAGVATPPKQVTLELPTQPEPLAEIAFAKAETTTPRPKPRPHVPPFLSFASRPPEIPQQMVAVITPIREPQHDPVNLPSALAKAPKIGTVPIAALLSAAGPEPGFALPAGPAEPVPGLSFATVFAGALSTFNDNVEAIAREPSLFSGPVSRPAARSATDEAGPEFMAALPSPPLPEPGFVPAPAPVARRADAPNVMAASVPPSLTPQQAPVPVPPARVAEPGSAETIVAEVTPAPVSSTASPDPEAVRSAALVPPDEAEAVDLIVLSAPAVSEPLPKSAPVAELDLVTRAETLFQTVVTAASDQASELTSLPRSPRTRFLAALAAAVLTLVALGVAVAIIRFMTTRKIRDDDPRVDRVKFSDAEEASWAKLAHDAQATS